MSNFRKFYTEASVKDWIGLIIGTTLVAIGVLLAAYVTNWGLLLVPLAIVIPLKLYVWSVKR